MVTVSLSPSEGGGGTPWRRGHAAAAFPAPTPRCCPRCRFLSKDRLSCEDDPVLKADAGVPWRLGGTRLKGERPASAPILRNVT